MRPPNVRQTSLMSAIGVSECPPSAPPIGADGGQVTPSALLSAERI